MEEKGEGGKRRREMEGEKVREGQGMERKKGREEGN